MARGPDIQEKIEKAWQNVRQRDMEYVATINNASRFSHVSPEQWITFRKEYGQLYDNPILARYMNQVGQKLVPTNSPNIYVFRLLLDPVPRAEALSTGTIMVSTGLVSMLDNEAQLSYILAHEIAHVERRHAYNRLRNVVLEEEFSKEKQTEVEHKRRLFGAIAGVAGAAIGGAAGGGTGALYGALAGVGAGTISGHFIFRNKFEQTEWAKEFEDEADEAGLKYMLEQNYDAREIPRLYARMQNMVSRDNRVGLGFVGSPERTRERSAQIQNLLSTTYKADLEGKMKVAGLTGSSPEFALLMAALKRDNGIAALDSDLFAMAKDNLEEASRLRSNDPRVHYYLGQVYAMTGRTPQDKQQAISSFASAIKYDTERGVYPESHLERALYLIQQNDASVQDQIKNELKTYVALYQRQHSGALPNNMYIIYDYLLLAGDTSWYVPPAAVVSTKNVDSLFVTQVPAPPSTDTSSVVQRAIATSAAPAVKPVTHTNGR